MKKVAYLAHVLVVALGLSLVACGGGGGGGGGPSGGAPGGSTGGAGSGGAAGGGAGGGSGGSSSGGGTAVGTARLGPNLGQALLGPIVGAIVRVYEAENFNGIVVCTVTTSFAGAPQGPGVIDLSTCPISVSSVYFLVVSGGMDIDANDDKVIDAAPTAKTGSLRAIISGRSIRDGNFRVNIVTELAYQGVADTLFSGAGDAEILARVDGLARQLLSSDLNGDGIVDNEDLVDFSPVEDGGFVADAYEDLLSEILAAILSGDRGELTRLSRQLLLGSLGEHEFAMLVNRNNVYQNLFIRDLIVEDDFIYAAGHDIGSPAQDLQVFVLDATDFSAVSLVGKYSIENLSPNTQNLDTQLMKVGNFLYVASQANGLFVVDVSDPAKPSGTLRLPGRAIRSLVLGDEDTMYLGFDEEPFGRGRGIYAVDIANPANPTIVNSFADGAVVFRMLYVEGMLYVYGAGVMVFDASSPTNPVQRGAVMFAGSSGTALAYHNGFVYAPITDASAVLQGMTTVDVRDPLHPQRVDDIAGLGLITEIDVHEDTLYAISSTSFGSSHILTAFDIGPDGRLELVDSRSSPGAYYLDYDNGRVYLATALHLTAYDANALNKRVEHFAFLATDKAANYVEVVGNVAYVGNETELLTVDVSDPAGGLPILDRVSVLDRINGIEIVDGYAYLANATEGFRIVDVRDPRDLKILGSNAELNPFSVNGGIGHHETFAIAMKGNLAYTVVGGYPDVKIGVFDVTNRMAPTVVHSVGFPYALGALVVNNNTLYGVDTFGGFALYMLDIQGAPTLSSQSSARASAFELDGAYLYTTSRTAGLSIYSVANERNPVLLGSALSLGIGHAVSVAGNVAYVANDFGMVETYDVLDKAKPKLVGQLPMGGVVKDVFATDEYVYAVNSLGLVIEPAVNLHEALE